MPVDKSIEKDISRFLPVTVLGVLLALASVSFQNCSQYSADSSLTDSESSDTTSTCDPTDPTCSDLSNVQLTIANQDPLLVSASPGGSNGTCDSSTCVDVAGYCDVDGFTSNKISAAIVGPVSMADTNLGTCDAMGRFRFLLPMPAGFIVGQTYTVTVTMRIYDASGNAFVNPSGLNQKTITLTSSQ